MVSASGIRAPRPSVLAERIAGIALVESELELEGLGLELVLVPVQELERLLELELGLELELEQVFLTRLKILTWMFAHVSVSLTHSGRKSKGFEKKLGSQSQQKDPLRFF